MNKLLPPVCCDAPQPLSSPPLRLGASSPRSTQNSPSPARRWRIALYSHDTMGLGHKRRNLLIAQTLGDSDLQANILMISGMRDASSLPTPPGVDCLTLPALYKHTDGQYQSRRLEISLAEIISLRSQVICSALQAFQPNIFIVDNVPRGAVRELDLALEWLHLHSHTRCILGLRDILDAPSTIQRDWQRAANEEAIRTYYDEVWVYGDAQVYDITAAYGFPADVTAKVHHLGYLDQRHRLQHARPRDYDLLHTLQLPPRELVLGTVGGGQDGANLALAFAQAPLPPNTNGIIVTGPFMPAEARQKISLYGQSNPRLRVLDYVEEPTLLLDQADRVIAMGGYNTVCEILSFEKQALIVPRVQPRQEQLIRAERLTEMGLISMLHPDRVTPEAIAQWLQQPRETPKGRDRLNLQGLQALPQRILQILAKHHPAQEVS